MTFQKLGLSRELIELLQQDNICEPLPIQQKVIPEALSGKNLLVSSQTGSGKTLSYLLPLVMRLRECQIRHQTRALILAPTRELAQQIGQCAAPLCASNTLNYTVIVGGVDYEPQIEALGNHPDIVISTPGRLIDLLEQGVTQISQLEVFILDEVDQMLDLGFREPITKLAQLRDAQAQTLGFSATLPDKVAEIMELLSENIQHLSIEDAPISVATIEHLGYYVSFEMMDHLLLHLLRREQPQQSIIFTRSRKMADRVVSLLTTNNIEAEAMHSDRSQAAREHILDRFRSGETSILVATDVIARGIDIDTITHVFNFGLPQNAEQYIHRTGRVGRAGRTGIAISLFSPDEKPMVDAICKLMKRHIVIDNSHPYITSQVTQALSPKKRTKKRGR